MKALSVCLEVNEVQPRGGYGIVDNEGGINWCLHLIGSSGNSTTWASKSIGLEATESIHCLSVSDIDRKSNDNGSSFR
ncbi:MAG TPA: hypothetical protein VI728_08450, partial [Syntrophales bacterium]|nr:hypothetical protein [Syntrophales bacterium]